MGIIFYFKSLPRVRRWVFSHLEMEMSNIPFISNVTVIFGEKIDEGGILGTNGSYRCILLGFNFWYYCVSS